MEDLVKIIKESLKTDLDSVVAVGGIEGSGKSTLSIHLSRKLDDKFQLKRNVIFQPTVANITKKIYGLPRYSPVDIDEAMRTMYKRNFATTESKTQALIFSMCRKQNKPIFLNIPNFFDLDSYYRNHRVRVWIFIPKRGLAMVLMKDPSPFITDTWHQKENHKIVERIMRKDKFSIQKLIIALRQTRNYVYEFEFPDLDDKTKSLYKYYSDKLNPMDLIKRSKWEIRVQKLLKVAIRTKVIKKVNWEDRTYKEAPVLTLKELAKLLKMSEATILDYEHSEDLDQYITEEDFEKFVKKD